MGGRFFIVPASRFVPNLNDSVPDAFSFTDQTGVTIGALTTSAPVTIAGITVATGGTVSGGAVSINGGAFTSLPFTVNNGDSIRAQHTSSGSGLTAVNTLVTIGGVSDTFTSTTQAADTTPDAFTFTDIIDSPVGTVITSDPITVAGINAPSTITVTGGTYDKNGSGSFTSSAGTVVNGDTVRARHTSNAANSTATNTVVTIGGVSDTFTDTTLASGGGGGAVGNIVDDDFEDRTVQSPISISGAWVTKGYTSVELDGTVAITNRAGAPAAMLAVTSKVSAGKQRFLHIQYPGSEPQSRITNLNALPGGLREMYVSWLEYRPNNNRSGEKWFRCGNLISGDTRGHDIIVGWANDTLGGLACFSNSSFMFEQQDFYGNVISYASNIVRHFEVRVKLSSGTNSDGAVQVWQDGTQVASTTNFRHNRDAGDAARNLTLFEFMGGWSSGGSQYPIDRWYPGGIKISTTRLGPWTV